MTGIPDDTRIFFPNDTGKVAQPGRGGPIGEVLGSKEDTVLLSQHAKIFIEVDENIDEDSPQLSDAFRAEQPNIFYDPALDIAIKPVYRQTDVKINFRYRADDKTAAQRWRNEMMARLAARMEVRLHTLTYSYPIPLEFLYILKELHRLRENNAGYGEDFKTYFKAFSDERITTIVDQTGGNELIVVPETQGRVQGWFDFAEMPERGGREGDGANWNIGFTYEFKYTKPIAAIMTYPIIVHQQMLTRKFRPDPDSEIPNVSGRHGEYRSVSVAALKQFEAGRDYDRNRAIKGYSIPYFDEFLPRSVLKDTRRMMTVLCRIDKDDPRALFKLAEVKELPFTEPFKKFLIGEAPWMPIPYESIVNLSIYCGYDRLHQSKLAVDSHLNIRATTDCDLRKQYRVRMSLVTDLSRLSPSAIERLRENGSIFEEIIKYLYPQLLPIKRLPDGSVPWSEWKRVSDETAKNKKVLDDPALINKYSEYWGKSSIIAYRTDDRYQPTKTEMMSALS
jgi:hypothetical protein